MPFRGSYCLTVKGRNETRQNQWSDERAQIVEHALRYGTREARMRGLCKARMERGERQRTACASLAALPPSTLSDGMYIFSSSLPART